MAGARFEGLEDGSLAGTIEQCPGVVAFGTDELSCEQELRSTLEDWVLLGLKLRHPLPVIEGINLNEEPQLESLGSL